ncbi:inositol monophosphatase family protein [Kozakia baliensis]|uniref:Uncharacterized protein n=1 Tax=Kozakia baliensis TaxID=153496 RepID=A0A1D8UVC0_9PROT|nr:inositol monophosphatase family protein [Kozakia baliensis]AOX17568.1 hypothetical protein A0U89_10905 [Kozakia baliensis]GBR31005.1 inositol monophosphatase [Kozakia baliensis NRIC 0488]GEL62955.1 inositol monophosphatase [Kozakia baliensis]
MTTEQPGISVTRNELDRVVAIARDAARHIIMPRFRNLSDGDVRNKGNVLDLVTIADEMAERHIVAQLRDVWPDALMVGEESCALEPELRLALPSARLAITIDPIDGTANYAAGLPLFGVMIAVASYGVPLASVILDPISMDAALALRGQGAWTDRDGKVLRRLHMAAPTGLHQMTGKAAWRNLPTRNREKADTTFREMASLWDFRCAAHEYLLTAEGAGHFLLYTRSLPWDHLPGWLLLHEAGGYGARLDGLPYDLKRPNQGLLYAPDQRTWNLIHQALALD